MRFDALTCLFLITVTKSDIEEHFSSHGSGKITEIKLMNGFGFIEYDDQLDARDIVPGKNGPAYPFYLCADLLTLFSYSVPYVPMTCPPITPRLSIPQTAVTSKASDSPFSLHAVLAARRPSRDHLIAMLSLVHVALCSACRFPVFQKQVGRLAAQIHSFPEFLT